ncbi:hypothetical protein BV898_12453 [Hypsibius exemplaris]|uniref:Uncharacterized protein n=1 Tax=Hypsibius exemplaris TaxID=2072580 RepID=A0A1W0WDY5_HYPEX|nr:hypothetical protein BV898_12453 [Hypsibius exemplaris]
MVISRNLSDFDDSITEALRLGDLVYFEKLLRTISRDDPATVTPSPLKYLNVNVFDAEGWTMLHRCCINGKLDLLKILLELGADVSLASRDGWNALHLAVYNGHRDISSFLMASSSGSNASSPSSSPPSSPATAVAVRGVNC